MCLLLFALDCHPRHSLVVVANRDEFLARDAEPLHRWGDARGIVAGRDRKAQGTWLGMNAKGRFAALTNHRAPRDMRARDPGAPSRGALVRGFLESDRPIEETLSNIAEHGHQHQGYNLLAGDVRSLHYTSNRTPSGPEITRVEPGIHGLSNHLLDTPWPKVVRGKAALAAALSVGAEIDVEALFHMMTDDRPAPDAELPDTGVGLLAERRLSPMFIRMPEYGTRCTTVVLADRSGKVTMIERTHAPERLPDSRVELQSE